MLGLLCLITGVGATVLFGIANSIICKNSERRMQKRKTISKIIIGVIIAIAILLLATCCISFVAMGWYIYTIPFILLYISLCIGLLFDSTPRPNKPYRVSLIITLVSFIIAIIIWLVKLII